MIHLLLGFTLLEGSCLYTPLMGFSSIKSVNADVLTAFLHSPMRAETPPFTVAFPQLRVPHFAERFFPLRAPSNALLWDFRHLEYRH